MAIGYKSGMVALLGLCLLSAAVLVKAQGAAPTVHALESGWYKQYFKATRVTYLVDTISRLCYAVTASGVTQINCRQLKRRPEWANVVSWGSKIKGANY